jgi:hypothetical protein
VTKTVTRSPEATFSATPGAMVTSTLTARSPSGTPTVSEAVSGVAN